MKYWKKKQSNKFSVGDLNRSLPAGDRSNFRPPRVDNSGFPGPGPERGEREYNSRRLVVCG